MPGSSSTWPTRSRRRFRIGNGSEGRRDRFHFSSSSLRPGGGEGAAGGAAAGRAAPPTRPSSRASVRTRAPSPALDRNGRSVRPGTAEPQVDITNVMSSLPQRSGGRPSRAPDRGSADNAALSARACKRRERRRSGAEPTGAALARPAAPVRSGERRRPAAARAATRGGARRSLGRAGARRAAS